jgi:hypothetical protein
MNMATVSFNVHCMVESCQNQNIPGFWASGHQTPERSVQANAGRKLLPLPAAGEIAAARLPADAEQLSSW